MHSACTSSHDVKQPISFPRRMSAPGALHRCFTHPESRGGRSAERRSGAALSTRGAYHDAIRQALARRLASHDAGRSPLGAPPWRFWAPGAALPSPSAPAVLQRRAGALRIRAASSSHPGRSAWRAGSLPPEANGYEPPPQDATPRSAFRIVSGDAPHERGWECSNMTPISSQQKYTTCSQKRKAALGPCRPRRGGSRHARSSPLHHSPRLQESNARPDRPEELRHVESRSQ